MLTYFDLYIYIYFFFFSRRQLSFEGISGCYGSNSTAWLNQKPSPEYARSGNSAVLSQVDPSMFQPHAHFAEEDIWGPGQVLPQMPRTEDPLSQSHLNHQIGSIKSIPHPNQSNSCFKACSKICRQHSMTTSLR